MIRRRTFAFVSAAAAILALMLVPGVASAAIDDVFGGEVNCTVQGDGDRVCGSDSPRSTVETFDGVPIDVNVAFPPVPPSGPDGDYPLVMMFHGYGGGKIGFGDMQHWLDQGYATFSMTDRGFRESCGSAASQAADPGGCDDGYVRLIDKRYEARDAQLFAGMLADEGLVAPEQIAAIGGSYGGGISLMLAALRNRMAMPNGDLVPWESPDGTPMEIAAANPRITWSDLAYALTPNGSTLDYVADAPYVGRFGVMKESYVNGLYFSGLGAPGFYAPEGSDPSSDLVGWRARLLEGEPYDGDPAAEQIRDEITENHSPYYVDPSVPPAPALLANAWADDLFPVDEMVRFYNRTRTQYPDAEMSLFAGDIPAHPRGNTNDFVSDKLDQLADQWFAYYVKGEGSEPFQGVRAYPETCPDTDTDPGLHRAKSWARLAKGEVRATSEGGTIIPDGGNEGIAAAFNPISGGGACVQTDGADEPGGVSIRFDPAPEGGLTVLGSATVIADFDTTGDTSQVAARLTDVGPDGQQTLIARGLWRPTDGDRQVFQMHPGGWELAEGHVAKVELLPKDWDPGLADGYARVSNDQGPIEVGDVEVRLPVAERAGSVPGLVRSPAQRFLPDGYDLAADFIELGDPRAKLAKGPLKVRGGKLTAGVKCPGRFDSCNDGKLVVKKAGGKRKFKVAKGSFEGEGGEVVDVRMKLTKRAKRYFAKHDGMSTKSTISSIEADGKAKQGRKARKGR